MASFTRPTANRAVHLRITPRPSNISESREILRLVSKFGEVEYFKNLKYDVLSHPSAALVIFRKEEAAENCIRRTPIRFRLGPAEPEDQFDPNPRPNTERTPAPAPASQAPHPPPARPSPQTPSSAPFGIPPSRPLSTTSLPTPPRAPPPLPFLPTEEPSPKTPAPSRTFQLMANRARQAFRDAVDRSEYHGRFVIDTKTAIQQDLAKRVPTPGLSAWDWRKPEKPDRIYQRLRRAESEGRKSLGEIWEEGRRAGEG